MGATKFPYLRIKWNLKQQQDLVRWRMFSLIIFESKPPIKPWLILFITERQSDSITIREKPACIIICIPKSTALASAHSTEEHELLFISVEKSTPPDDFLHTAPKPMAKELKINDGGMNKKSVIRIKENRILEKSYPSGNKLNKIKIKTIHATIFYQNYSSDKFQHQGIE